MNLTATDPIFSNWTIDTLEPDNESATTSDRHDTETTPATAADVIGYLGLLDAGNIKPQLVPYLAYAAAEMAVESGIPWRFCLHDAPVALLRLIAKVSIRNPSAGGTHTARLLEKLR